MTCWLDNVQIGDKVIIADGSDVRTTYRFGVIEKITPTRQFKVSGISQRFKQDGYLPVGPREWFGSHLEQWTLERETEIKNESRRIALIVELQNASFDKLSLNQLRKIKEIMQE